MRRPRPKFKVSFYLYFCCFWINVTQINFENIKRKIQRIISDSCFQLKSWFNVDARAPSIPLLNFPFKGNQAKPVMYKYVKFKIYKYLCESLNKVGQVLRKLFFVARLKTNFLIHSPILFKFKYNFVANISLNYRLSKKKYNRTFSINSFQNCELIWICFRTVKHYLIVCIFTEIPTDLVQ